MAEPRPIYTSYVILGIANLHPVYYRTQHLTQRELSYQKEKHGLQGRRAIAGPDSPGSSSFHQDRNRALAIPDPPPDEEGHRDKPRTPEREGKARTPLAGLLQRERGTAGPPRLQAGYHLHQPDPRRGA